MKESEHAEAAEWRHSIFQLVGIPDDPEHLKTLYYNLVKEIKF